MVMPRATVSTGTTSKQLSARIGTFHAKPLHIQTMGPLVLSPSFQPSKG